MPDQTLPQALNPNFDPQALARLLYQQQMGNAFMQEGIQDVPQGQMVSGHYVAPAVSQQLARLANVLLGSKMASEAQGGINQTEIDNMRAMMGNLGASGSAQGAGANGGDPFTQENAIRSMILGQIAGPEASKAFWARNAPQFTQDQLNSRDPLIGGSVQNNLRTQNMVPVQKLIEMRQQVPDGSQEAKILDAAIAKENFVKPVEVGEGTLVLNPTGDHAPFAYNPKNGMATTFQFNNGTTTPTGAQGLPGYAQGSAAIEGAQQGAKSANTIINVTTPSGANVPAWGGPAASAGGRTAGLTGYAGGTRQSADAMRTQVLNSELQQALKTGDTRNAALIRQEMQRTGISEAPTLGQSQTAKAMTDQGIQTFQRASSEAANVPQFRQALNEMWSLASSGKFGPGTPQIARVKALLSNAGVDMSGAQTDQDVMKKMASFISSSQLGGGTTTGTDAQLNNLLAGLPHGDMPNDAMKKVIPLLVSQLDVKEARATVARNYMQAHPNDASGMAAHMTQFNQMADPGTVSLGKQMAAATANGTARQLAGKLQQQYGKAWPQMLQRVQALHQLGAF